MSKILNLLHDRLQQDASYHAGQQALGCHTHPVTWVDDLAVPLTASSTPGDLVPLTRRVVAVL